MRGITTGAAVAAMALASHAFAQRTYELRVRADDPVGTRFRNPEASRAKCEMKAYGTWSVAIDSHSVVDADGYYWLGDCREACMTSSAPGGALIMRRGNAYSAAGRSATFDLEPGEEVHFLMNDLATGTAYRDNEGVLSLAITCSPA